MAENEGARKIGKAYVMCTTPDVCLTNGCPVPYSIISYLDCAQKEVETVRMTGQCALSMDSHLTTVIGDGPGSGGGIASGVNLGYCVPITHSSTVRAKGQNLLYHSSEFWMNCPGPEGSGNTKGKLQYIQDDGGGLPIIDPQGTIAADTNPPVTPETPKEDAWWQTGLSWLHTGLDVVGLVPVLGEVADGANAAIHGVEAAGYGLAGNKARALENTGMAVLSVAAMWPAGGQAATATKFAIKGGKELVEAGVKKEAKHLLKEGLEEGGEGILKKETKEVAEQVTDGVQVVKRQQSTKTERLAEHLTDADLNAAKREAAGEVVARKADGTPWDHVKEVRDAQQGLLNRIEQIKRKLGSGRLTGAEGVELQQELSQASKLLDKSEEFLPR